MGSQGKCSGWTALHDTQPVKPHTLYVTGKCTFPTAGYSVELRPHLPQGINPAIYIMDKIVHEPTGPVNQVLTTVDVRYSEKTDAHYKEVHILPDDVHVPVKEVS
jgi:hypothetical protein